MKKLNEVRAIELLTELQSNYEYSLTKDCVQIRFYANTKRDMNRIVSCYTLDAVGDWLLDKTVKAFNISIREMIVDEILGVDIDIVINM